VLPRKAAAPLWSPPPKAIVDRQSRLAFGCRCARRFGLAACLRDFDLVVGDFLRRPNSSGLRASLDVLSWLCPFFTLLGCFAFLFIFPCSFLWNSVNITEQPEGGDILGNAGKIHSGYFFHWSCGTIVLDLSFQLNWENRREKRKARHISGKTRFQQNRRAKRQNLAWSLESTAVRNSEACGVAITLRFPA
jgi:hypothetical protein